MRCEHPQVLWLALAAVPALAGFLYWSWRVKQKLILQFVHARLLSSLTVGISPVREKIRLALLVAALAGILCALARPQWGFAWEEAKQQGLDIIVALDTSRSMLARDVLPDRLERSKLAVMDLMRQAKSDRMGLVVFAGAAFLQAPLTLDEQAFQQAVEAVSVGIVPVGGTSLSSAIHTTMDAFEKGNDNHKVMVLFTDGEDHDADKETMAAAKEAADSGMRIFTIGVGTPEGELLRETDEQGNNSFIKDDDGNVVKSHLNQTLLQQIATEANGFYLPLQGANPVETLYARGLAPLPKTEESTRLTRVFQERYHWFLGFAVICLVVEALLPERARSRRSRPAASVLQTAAAALVLCLIPLSSDASPGSAFRDYQAGKFTNAFDEYNRLVKQKTNDFRLHYDAGEAAYQARKLEAAEEQFNSTLNTPDIISDPQNQQRTYYNLGNTLYRMGEPLPDPDKKKELWQQAITNYSRAIHLNTNDMDARNNLAFVKQELEELKKQQQQQQQKNKDKDKDDKKDKQKQDQDQQQQGNDQKDQKDQQQKDSQNQKSEQQKKDEEKAKQEQAKKDQEKKEQQAQANQGEKKENQDEKDKEASATELHMSPQEARKLLESLKDDAKVLLFSPTNQPINTQRGKFKDW
jgi:Ca-activated chloride channel family protein